MEQTHPLVVAYQETVLGFDPPAYAKMNRRGALHKYSKVVIDEQSARIYPPLTSDLIQAHLRGDITVAACLIDPQGASRASALDIDEGGEEVLRRVLDLAAAQGFTAFAQSSENEEHQGGHVWLLFDQSTEPRRLRQLAQQLATQAGIRSETYPTKKTIRLPLGIHRWTGKRGRLLLSDGRIFELDAGEHLVRHAVRILRDLPRNSIKLLPPLLIKAAPAQPSVRRLEGVRGDTSAIQQFNQAANLIGLLERSGGRVAQHLANGGVLMHCPCPHHKNGDARPSLELKPARNRQRYGEFVAFGYSPSCHFYTESGHVIDAFGVLCLLEGLTPSEATKKLRGE